MTVVASFDVTQDGETEKGVKTHEKAWVMTLEGPHPATANFVGWLRKD
jgi:hypothetical protein